MSIMRLWVVSTNKRWFHTKQNVSVKTFWPLASHNHCSHRVQPGWLVVVRSTTTTTTGKVDEAESSFPLILDIVFPALLCLLLLLGGLFTFLLYSFVRYARPNHGFIPGLPSWTQIPPERGGRKGAEHHLHRHRTHRARNENQQTIGHQSPPPKSFLLLESRCFTLILPGVTFRKGDKIFNRSRSPKTLSNEALLWFCRAKFNSIQYNLCRQTSFLFAPFIAKGKLLKVKILPAHRQQIFFPPDFGGKL